MAYNAMNQGIKLLKRRMRATRPQDFKQELTRNYPEIVFLNSNYQQLDSNFSAIIISISNYQQLISNYFFNRNYQELTRNYPEIVFLNSNYQQLDSN